MPVDTSIVTGWHGLARIMCAYGLLRWVAGDLADPPLPSSQQALQPGSRRWPQQALAWPGL